MRRLQLVGAGLAGLTALLSAGAVRAEPYLAVLNGYKCNVCHVNPTGGGLRNDFGTIYAQTLMPSDTSNGTSNLWNGKLGESLHLGGDLRADWERNSVPHQANRQQFSLEQVRVYGDFALIPNTLGIYVDELVAPNSPLTMEAYVRYGTTANGWYLKGGKFYLPFGWRLQDQTAFVREVTGISMTTPDNGVELGYERGVWSAHLALTNGAANAGAGSGHQVTTQAVYVQPRWRLGAAASFTQSAAGNRRVAGIFAGVRAGPVALLGEADLVRDEGFPGGARNLRSALGEADFAVARGQNVKLTAEYYDPDQSVRQDQQTRYSLLYEFTPLPFIQLRAGFRRYRGIPQNDLQNRRLTVVELHGFF